MQYDFIISKATLLVGKKKTTFSRLLDILYGGLYKLSICISIQNVFIVFTVTFSMEEICILLMKSEVRILACLRDVERTVAMNSIPNIYSFTTETFMNIFKDVYRLKTTIILILVVGKKLPVKYFCK